MGRRKTEAKQWQEKTRICIRIDTDLLDYFRKEAALTVTAEDGAAAIRRKSSIQLTDACVGQYSLRSDHVFRQPECKA